MTTFTESIVEEATLAWLEALGYAVLHRLFTCSVTQQASAPVIAAGYSSVSAVYVDIYRNYGTILA